MTTFLLLKNYDHYVIVNDDADVIAGRVYPLNGLQGPYRVRVDVWPRHAKTREAGIVTSLNDAIPAFLAYYEKYPLRWDRLDCHEYRKFTSSVHLRVKQDQRGYWLAYRDNYLCFAVESPPTLAQVTKLNEPPTRTSSTSIRTPNQSTMVSHSNPIQRSTGAQSRIVWRSGPTGNGARPVFCLDIL